VACVRWGGLVSQPIQLHVVIAPLEHLAISPAKQVFLNAIPALFLCFPTLLDKPCALCVPLALLETILAFHLVFLARKDCILLLLVFLNVSPVLMDSTQMMLECLIVCVVRQENLGTQVRSPVVLTVMLGFTTLKTLQ
jgi:hypothetical protein